MANFVDAGGLSGPNPANDATNTQVLQNMLDAGGRSIFFPDGDFAFKKIVLPDNVTLVADNPSATALRTTETNANILTAGVSFSIRGIKLTSFAPMTGGAFIYSEKNDTVVDGCEMENLYRAVEVQGTSGNLRVAPVIKGNRARFFSTAAGSGFCHLNGVSSALYTENIITGPETGNQPAFGLRIQQCDTVQSSNNNVTLMGRALQIDPVGTSCIGFNSIGDFWDSGQYQSAYIIPGAGGQVINTGFIGTWFGLAKSGDDLLLNADSGLIGDITLSACRFKGGVQNGLHAHGPIKGLKVIGADFSGHVWSDIYMSGGVSNWSIEQAFSDNSDGRGLAQYGLNIAAGSTGFVARGRFRGSVQDVLNGGTGMIENW